MTKVSARWVPKLLGAEQKRLQYKMSKNNLVIFDADPEKFIRQFMTMDETWVHHFQPESKEQSKQWKHYGLPAPKAKPVISAGKVMASIFLDFQGVILVDWWLTKGQSITGQYYANFLRQLQEKIKKNWHDKLSLGVLFHQDNAAAHKSAMALAAIHDCSFQLVEHLTYSPDLAPSHYYLFPRWKKSSAINISS